MYVFLLESNSKIICTKIAYISYYNMRLPYKFKNKKKLDLIDLQLKYNINGFFNKL